MGSLIFILVGVVLLLLWYFVMVLFMSCMYRLNLMFVMCFDCLLLSRLLVLWILRFFIVICIFELRLVCWVMVCSWLRVVLVSGFLGGYRKYVYVCL